jgi:hypothetical protein
MRSSSRFGTWSSADSISASHLRQRASSRRRGGGGRVEAGHEQRDQHRRDTRVCRQRAFDIGVAERRAHLAQVLGVGAQDRHVARGQPRAQHQAVEVVVLDLAIPGAAESVLEQRLDLLDLDIDRLAVGSAAISRPKSWIHTGSPASGSIR